jgi:single-stranded-DNA-specific exonuclease
MSLDNTKLYNSKSSILDAYWYLLTLDNETQRLVDYLYQTHKLPNYITPYLSFKGMTFENFDHFLSPKLKYLLPDPYVFKDLEKGVNRLAEEVLNCRPIGIFGDYDVDGATSAALISNYLEYCGCETFIHIPDRFLEGYGPNEKALKGLHDKGAELIITVDCGISSFEPLKAMSSVNLDLIVIDHHIPDITLPPAYAIINPKRIDTQQGYEDLCAAGVTFIFLIGLNRELRNKGFFKDKKEPNLFEFLDLVALGTVCDVVPLRGLNRAFVKQGLSVMKKRQNLGIKALCDVSNVSNEPNTQALGFSLGPRINAGGRIGNSELGVYLLKGTDEFKSIEIANKLDDLNKKRRLLTSELEKSVIGQIEKNININNNVTPNIIVVSGKNFHEGIIGIVAGRMKELYNRPVCIIAVSTDGVCKGSGRSVNGVPLGDLILEASKLKILSSGGGHDMAAGFTIKEDKIDEFSEFLINKVNLLMNKVIPKVIHFAASVIPISGCTLELAEWLENLGPWGTGMEEPKFIIPNAKISSLRKFGVNKEHISFYISDRSSKKLKVKKFNILNNPLNKVFDNYENVNFSFLGRLNIDTWNNSKSLEMMLDDIIYEDVT